YPDFEVIICAESEAVPALSAARQVAARHPERQTRFEIAPSEGVLNPKVGTLAPGFAAARHGTILIRDSNIALAPDHLSGLAAALTDDVGLVCAIPAADAPSGLSAQIEQAEMNGRAAPYTLAAAMLGINVGYGKVMLFRRADFEAIGGIAAIADSFGDDHALSRGVARLGRATVYTPTVAVQRLGRRTWRDVWTRQSRWMVIRRQQAFAAFVMEPFTGTPMAVVAALFAAPALGLSPWTAAVGTVVWRLAAEIAAIRLARWPAAAGYPLAALMRDIAIPVIWLPAWWARRVNWIGQSHKISTEVNNPSRPATHRR
ncbi:MAG: glycosyltransferase, partial [Rhodobiaceae bacterium]|nr:glycosyltransferase [Rhodobiaceae bacterium]